MKNLLLLFLAVIFSASLFAQAQADKLKPTLSDAKPSHIKHLASYDQLMTNPSGSPQKTISESRGMQKFEFASSANIYSLISTDQSALTVEQDHDAVVFFARAGGNYGATGNDLRISSAIFGSLGTWNHELITPETGKRFRYPSGSILDHPGANSLSDCYGAFSGPVTGGSGWTHNFMGSMKFDGSTSNVVYDPLPSGTYFAHANSNMIVCNDSTVHVAGDNYVGTSADYSWGNGILYNGKFDPATMEITWDPMMTMTHNFAIDSSDMNIAASSTSMAWNEDGSVGYYIFLGRDSANDTRSYQPIVYKSVDQGATWNLEPVFDFSTLSSITDNIWPTRADANKTKAFFSYQMEPVVDHNGLLHIFGLIQGSFSDHKDSLGFTYMYEPDKLFHVYMLPGGGWEAELIHEMYTFEVSADDQLFGSGSDAMGWTHRINASRSEDGSKMIVVWGDTDTTLAAPNSDGFLINSAPDIYAVGKDLTTNTTYPVTNFTVGTMFWGDNFFHYASDIIYEDGNGNMIVPVTTADIGPTPLDQVNHNLLMTVGFGPTIGVEENSTQNSLMNVSQNFPNPFNDRTNISVELKQGADLSIDVYNMLGQRVHQESKGKVNAGAYNFMVSASELSAGVYFYRVTADRKSVTKKMIVR